MSDLPVDDLAARQRAAIEASGWGERFRLVQWRNPVFWLLLWCLVNGVVHLARFYRPGLDAYGGALAAGTVLFAIYTLPWTAFLHHRDRFVPEAPKILATGFVWGALVATTFLALTVNSAVLTLYMKLFGQAWAADWSAGLTAPFTEETAKALGFFVIVGLAPKLVRTAHDAFVIGAFIGLGFQVAEDVLYVFQGAGRSFGTDQPFAVGQMVLVRGFSGIVSHALFTALVCTGIAWVTGRTADGRHVARGITVVGIAMFVHFLWDDGAAVGTSLFGSVGALPVLGFASVVGIGTVLKVAQLASGTERTWMHDLLAPEVAAGVLTDDEVRALAGSRHAERKHVKAIHGHHQRKVAHHVLEAAHDLAAAIATSGGPDTEPARHARAEVARLRSL
jgi:RsiW-degrading membrane proteinase PrsW (M82 family)